MRIPTAGLIAALLAAPLTADDGAASDARAEDATPSARAVADYERLGERRYGAAIALPAGGLELTRDSATIMLVSGTVRLAEPLDDGTVTGLVFEGAGRFSLEIPDAVERAQLARLTDGEAGSEASGEAGSEASGEAGSEGGTGLEERFSRLVLRGVAPLPATWIDALGGVPSAMGTSAAGGYQRSKLADRRHENWLERRFLDVDARIVAGRAIAGDDYLLADFDSERFGWLTWIWDPLRQEESLLARWHPTYGATEEWVSLDRAGERDGEGRPASRRRYLADVRHAEVEVDLTRASRKLGGRRGPSGMEARRARMRATLELVPRRSGLGALPLVLNGWSEVESVTDGDGRPLRFLRDPIGARSSTLDRDLFDDDLLVLFDRPLEPDRPARVTVVWERDFLGFLPGRDWYPGERDAWGDPHTARLAVLARDKHDVRATGAWVEESERGDGVRRQLWIHQRPTRSLSLTYAEKVRERRRRDPGGPEVVVVSHRGPGQVESVAEDVARSVAFFTELFAHPLRAETLTVLAIDAGHGQAFDGFLQLSRSTFDNAVGGRAERFRGHEVAHQWWGHTVGWASYRDQWLSEAVAELSAMLYLEASEEKGREYYDEIVAHYAGHALGTAPPSPRFSRLWALERNDARRARIGPIGLGYRAATAASPAGYFAQTYVKGALVLHMLRRLLRDQTGGDEVFVALWRELLDRHAGDAVSTRDLRAVLERSTGESWGWFFEQWIDGTAIPTYRWSWRQGPDPESPGRTRLTVEVEQGDVPAGFRMPVPVAVVRGDGSEERFRIDVDRPRVVWTTSLAAPPEGVRFNPGHAVLARVERLARPARSAP